MSNYEETARKAHPMTTRERLRWVLLLWLACAATITWAFYELLSDGGLL